jgi:Fe-S cluster assembly ATP-binding protein
MLDGRIVRSGGPEVAEDLEAQGYDVLRRELGLTVAPGDNGDPFADL